MGKAVTVEIRDENLTGALKALSRITGKDFRTVVRSETEKIIEGAARRTTMAQAKSIKANHDAQPVAYIEGYNPKRPRKGAVKQTQDGRIFYWLQNRYPAELWGMIQTQRNARLKEKLAARGLLRKTWYQMASDLGLKIKVAGQVIKATARRGDYPGDQSAFEQGSGSKFVISGQTTRTYDLKIFSALRAAIRGRVNYFRMNLKHGVFDSAKDIARKYPGLKVHG